MIQIFDKTSIAIIKLIIKVLIWLLILMGLDHVLQDLSDNKIGDYIWQLVLFAFLIGSFILSIKPEYIKKDQINILPKTGFLIIISSVFMISGHGISFASPGFGMSLFFIGNLSGIIFMAGVLLFSFALAELTVELGRNIFSKK